MTCSITGSSADGTGTQIDVRMGASFSTRCNLTSFLASSGGWYSTSDNDSDDLRGDKRRLGDSPFREDLLEPRRDLGRPTVGDVAPGDAGDSSALEPSETWCFSKSSGAPPCAFRA